MEKLLRVLTYKYSILYYVGAFVICFVFTFVWLGQVQYPGFDNPQTKRVVHIIAQQHKIETLQNKLNDLESGAYDRRIAVLSGEHVKDVRSYAKVNGKLEGRIAITRRELDEAKKKLAVLTGHEVKEKKEKAESRHLASL